MIRLISILIMDFFSAALFAQAPDTIWTKILEGSGHDEGSCVQQTTDGGYIITGYTLSSSDSGWYDIWLIKTNANGNTLWTKTFGDSLGDSGYSVQQTTDGGYIIVGNTNRAGRRSDVWLIKTDSNGDTLWTKTFGDSLTDYGFSVRQTKDEGYIITGSTHGDGSVWLIKTDSKGDTLWTKTFGYGLRNWGNSVQQTKDGGYIITGYAHYFEGGYLLLIKTDDNGDTLWTRIFEKYNSGGESVQQTSDGGYVIAGRGDADVWLIKTDANGDTSWTKNLVSPGIGNSVQQTSDGGYIITGRTHDHYVFLIKLEPDVTLIDENPQTIISAYQLQQNYPNPFNPVTTIEFSLPQSDFVSLTVYNILGEEVATLVSEKLTAGEYRYKWDASSLASGVYMYRMVAGDFVQVRKMILTK